MRTSLGSNLKSLREAKGWSQQRLADAAGVSQTTIDKVEQGITKRSRYIGYIAKALGTTIAGLDRNYPKELQELAEQDQIDLDAVNAVGLSGFHIPLYAAEIEEARSRKGIASKDHFGIFSLGRTPMATIPALPSYARAGVYGVYISFPEMFPEFAPGDIAVVSPKISPAPLSTCVFGTEEGENVSPLRVIGRVENITSANWKVANWLNAQARLSLPRKEWKIAHRVIAKYYRG